MSKQHLVLGATGGIGRAVVKSLLDENQNVKILVRDKKKAGKYFKNLGDIEIIEGNAKREKDVLAAVNNSASLFYCVNTPYPKWKSTVRELLKISIDACVKSGAKLIFPGNVYVYGVAQYNKVDEMHPKFPHTVKGEIRLAMERMLHRAMKDYGLNFTIVRMPDFYGPYVINGFSEQVFINALKGKPLKWIGDRHVPIEYLFIEDGGKAMVTAALSENADRKEFNLPACCETTSDDFLNLISEKAGNKSKRQFINSDVLFTALGLFNHTIREVKEMLYLKRHKLILDGSQFKRVFGNLPATPYEEGIEKTLHWAREFYKIKS